MFPCGTGAVQGETFHCNLFEKQLFWNCRIWMASSEMKIAYILVRTNRNSIGLVWTKDVQFQCIRRRKVISVSVCLETNGAGRSVIDRLLRRGWLCSCVEPLWTWNQNMVHVFSWTAKKTVLWQTCSWAFSWKLVWKVLQPAQGGAELFKCWWSLLL